MSTLSAATIASAQSGDSAAQTEVFANARPMLRAIASEFASNPRELEELEAEASLSLLEHLAGYKVGARASLTTYLNPRVRQDVRNAHFATRSGGTMDGDTYAEYTRVAGRVHADIRAERNQGGEEVRDGEVHARMREALTNLPGGHAWSEERFLAAHDLVHMGAQSMEAEDEDGAEFGTSLADPHGHGDPTSVIPDDYKSRAKAVSRAKRQLVAELMEQLDNRQAAVIAASFGLGTARGHYVHGVLEGSAASIDPITVERMGLTATCVTDQDLADALETTRANVRQIRKRALARLATHVQLTGATYPTIGETVTVEEQAVLFAVAENDEGTYVRVHTEPKGTDAEFHVINGEADRLVIAMSLGRAVELGVLEGETQEREIPKAPEAYTYMRLFGDGQVPADRTNDIHDSGHAIVHGVDQGPRSFAVTTRTGIPVMPESGVDYTAPVWEFPALSALHVLGRRSYTASH